MTNQKFDPAELNPISPVLTRQFLETLHSVYCLNWDGIHGFSHWVRVRENGLRVAEINGANPVVVELFAFIHDIKRENDRRDSQHGQRASDFVDTLGLTCYLINDEERDLLKYACAYHTNGWLEANITIQTCWDADRLDLGRIGIRPDPNRLCTAAARQTDIIEWAYQRSRINGWHWRDLLRH